MGTWCPGKRAALKGGLSSHSEYRPQLPDGRIWIICILTNRCDSCARTIYMKQNALISVHVICFPEKKENRLDDQLLEDENYLLFTVPQL